MNAWKPSTKKCIDCDGEAVAKTDQWGRVIHYECPECNCVIDSEELQ